MRDANPRLDLATTPYPSYLGLTTIFRSDMVVRPRHVRPKCESSIAVKLMYLEFDKELSEGLKINSHG